MRQQAVADFQSYLDALQGEFGFTIDVISRADGTSFWSYYAGMRVLEATPIFNRKTGAVQRWRYLLLFAEMGILDVYCCGHPVHVFECEVVERKDHCLKLKGTDGEKDFMICRNDPHEQDDRQTAIYRDWDAAVTRYGGKAAFQGLLDSQAAEWAEQFRIMREARA